MWKKKQKNLTVNRQSNLFFLANWLDLTNKVHINMSKMQQAESYSLSPTGGGGDYAGNDTGGEGNLDWHKIS